MEIESKIARLVRKTSSTLPQDALDALKSAMRREEKGSSARMVLETLVGNASLAGRNGTPMCQDTGTLTFFVDERLRNVDRKGVAAPEHDRFRDRAFDRLQHLRRRPCNPLRGAEGQALRTDRDVAHEGGRIREHEPSVLASRCINRRRSRS